MVILNFYGKLLQPVCISKKLRVFISNLPKGEYNNWNRHLVEMLEAEIKEREIFKEQYKDVPDASFQPYDLQKICGKQFPWENIPQNAVEGEYLQMIADNLICIYFDYNYEDMPFWDWTTNCFDGRLCEEDYAEKLMDFLQFVVRNAKEAEKEMPYKFPGYIYTSNHDLKHQFVLGRIKLYFPYDKEDYIASLQAWGKWIDNFLETPNDFYQLDFLMNAIYKDREYNAYHFLKSFSLCEMLLLQNRKDAHTRDIDEKLVTYIEDDYSKKEKALLAEYVRRIRNAIGHGNFMQLNCLTEKVGKDILDSHYVFDYTEFSRQNWILQSLCCILDNALARILYLYISDKNSFPDSTNFDKK